MALTLENGARSAACDAVVDRVDLGAGAGKLKIRATSTLLCTITLSDPAFGAASNGVATAQGLPLSGVGVAAGSANNFQVTRSGDRADVERAKPCRASSAADRDHAASVARLSSESRPRARSAASMRRPARPLTGSPASRLVTLRISVSDSAATAATVSSLTGNDALGFMLLIRRRRVTAESACHTSAWARLNRRIFFA